MCQIEHTALCRFCPHEEKCEQERQELREKENESRPRSTFGPAAPNCIQYTQLTFQNFYDIIIIVKGEH